ncbi:MAG: hypothetical protein GY813_19265 [Halieaceae bacterium]|nr:hypothetical protein [Halieaceae bacterium]
MHMANVEYRQELWDIETGLETLPFYLKKVHVAGLFVASGERLDMTLGTATSVPREN